LGGTAQPVEVAREVKRIEFRVVALDDIDSVADFYALVDQGIAERWINAVQTVAGEVSRRPSFGSTTHAEQLGIEGLRHRQVPRFPYLLFYIERDDSIAIVRVLHERRDVLAEFEE
jgi:toxin ParE1/3/4